MQPSLPVPFQKVILIIWSPQLLLTSSDLRFFTHGSSNLAASCIFYFPLGSEGQKSVPKEKCGKYSLIYVYRTASDATFQGPIISTRP